MVLHALSIAIEHRNRALTNCLERPGSAISNTKIGTTIHVRQQESVSVGESNAVFLRGYGQRSGNRQRSGSRSRENRISGILKSNCPGCTN